VVIEDDGPGFPPHVLEWLGEPYVSTRHAIGGLGLGVFIAQTLLARTGATLQFENWLSGARVIVTWSADAVYETAA
jgi:two-component system sensor histidine kinase RegB